MIDNMIKTANECIANFSTLTHNLESMQKMLQTKQLSLDALIEEQKNLKNFLAKEAESLEKRNLEIAEKKSRLEDDFVALDKQMSELNQKIKHNENLVAKITEREEILNTRSAEINKRERFVEMDERRLKLLDQRLKLVLEDKDVERRLKEIS